MRVIGLAIIAAVFAMIAGDHLGAFIDPPSLIIILGLPLGMLVWGRAPLGTMFGSLWNDSATEADLKAAAKAWQLARAYTVASGIIGFVMGLLIILAVADDFSQIGPGLAISLLTVVYAALLGYGIYLPLQARLEDRLQH